MAGDMLRAMAKDGDPKALQAKVEYLDHGLLVPDHLILDEVIKRCTAADAKPHGVVVDGFPVRVSQAEALFRALEAAGTPVTHVCRMRFDPEVVIERVTGRYTCPGCSRTYHDTLNPPARPDHCDVCGAVAFLRRGDDGRGREMMEMRLELFRKETLPVFDWCAAHSVPVFDIDAMAPKAGEFQAETRGGWRTRVLHACCVLFTSLHRRHLSRVGSRANQKMNRQSAIHRHRAAIQGHSGRPTPLRRSRAVATAATSLYLPSANKTRKNTCSNNSRWAWEPPIRSIFA